MKIMKLYYLLPFTRLRECALLPTLHCFEDNKHTQLSVKYIIKYITVHRFNSYYIVSYEGTRFL